VIEGCNGIRIAAIICEGIYINEVFAFSYVADKFFIAIDIVSCKCTGFAGLEEVMAGVCFTLSFVRSLVS